MATRSPAAEAVITFHPQSREAGRAILRAGGNASDAFIAATAADYVVAAGGTSLAGPLGVLVHEAEAGAVHYLDAEFNEVRKRGGRWQPGDDIGKTMLVPGAPAGLEALSRRHGRLPFAQCLAPAIRLAREGFVADGLYCRHLELCAGHLRMTDYGRRTFFRQGETLEPGDLVRQPELAALLERLARRGASCMYKGAWASRFVRTARAAGGLITMGDLARYRAVWREPWRTGYRGYTLHACSGRTFGGLWTLLCLKALEHGDLRRRGHWSRAADALEVVTRTIRQVWEETWLLDYRLLDDAEFVAARLTSRYGARIWKKIAKASPLPGRAMPGSHSYHVIVRDRDGNVASGTNTHESLAWGSGLFVDGVVLPASGYLPWGTRAGERRISPFAMIFAFREDVLRLATGSFSSSIAEASLQLLLNLIDYRCRAEDAVTLPRVGTFPHNPAAFLSNTAAKARAGAVDPGANWLDPRVPGRVVAAVERHGLAFIPDAARRRRAARCDVGVRHAEVDTGLGAVLTVGPGGKADGAITPWPGTTEAGDG
jgi:gamma-glutamyltranspeptidase / glutathione hydrolase